MNLNSVTESSNEILLGSNGVKIDLFGRPQNVFFSLKYHIKLQMVKGETVRSYFSISSMHLL